MKTKRAFLFLKCLIVLLSAGMAPGASGDSGWQQLREGIDYRRGAMEKPFCQAVHALRIDLAEPNLTFVTTASNGDLPQETTGQTTAEFLESHKLAAAINTGFFRPWAHSDDVSIHKDIVGLAVSAGSIVSPNITVEFDPAAVGTLDSRRAVRAGSVLMLVSGDNKITFEYCCVENIDELIADSYNALAGSYMLIKNGKNMAAGKRHKCFVNDRHPRTAIGLSADGRYLYFLVIDGRQPGYSMGATLYETADWLLRLGASDGINLDGGGSATMAIASADGKAAVLNKPSDGFMRKVANNIGVFYKNNSLPARKTEKIQN